MVLLSSRIFREQPKEINKNLFAYRFCGFIRHWQCFSWKSLGDGWALGDKSINENVIAGTIVVSHQGNQVCAALLVADHQILHDEKIPLKVLS